MSINWAHLFSLVWIGTLFLVIGNSTYIAMFIPFSKKPIVNWIPTIIAFILLFIHALVVMPKIY